MTEEEKEILYFIEKFTIAISGTQTHGWQFIMPILPSSKMGQEFYNKHKEFHEKVNMYLITHNRKIHFPGWDKPVILK